MLQKKPLRVLCALLCLLPVLAAQALPVTVTYCDSFPRLGLPEPKLEVIFLNLSVAGDCILIRSGGETMLLDSGHRPTLDCAWMNLRHFGVDKLDYILVTHYHRDHMENFSLMMHRGLRPRHAYLPNEPSPHRPLENDLLERLIRYDVPYSCVEDGDVVRVGEATLSIMRAQGDLGPNLRSVQAMLACGDARVYLTADATGEGQKQQMDKHGDNLRADIFKVAHHGYNLMMPGLYAQVQPELAVLTNNREDAATSVMQLNDLDMPFLWTTRGNIICQTDGETGWHVYQENKPVWDMSLEDAGDIE